MTSATDEPTGLSMTLAAVVELWSIAVPLRAAQTAEARLFPTMEIATSTTTITPYTHGAIRRVKLRCKRLVLSCTA